VANPNVEIPNNVPPADPATTGEHGWRRSRVAPSLQEVYRSVPVGTGGFFRKLIAFAGPGYLVAVGYMDPGNWATDLAGGSQFGYTLLSVILMSNLMAVLLQGLASKLGIVTGRDLAQACRDHYSRPVGLALWVACEIAIVACDLAELIGSALALKLLFGLPLLWGVGLTATDVLLVLMLRQYGVRLLEAVVIALVLLIGACFAVQIALAQPSLAAIGRGLLPSADIVLRPDMLYIAVGILGATVMPHNLYLHSSIVQWREVGPAPAARRQAIRYACIDSTLALAFACFINASILILAAAVFHDRGHLDVDDISRAHELLAPLLGTTLAATLFAVALLAAGQSSTLTGTLAGQIVMEGFLDLRLPAWARRAATRLLAIVPAAAVIAIRGEDAAGGLLVASQVVLSLQLPFAVVPLVMFTGDRRTMGEFANRRLTAAAAWTVATVIVALNLWLLAGTVRGWLAG
jgi:manganese transport protein